jgi:hypothetical protein
MSLGRVVTVAGGIVSAVVVVGFAYAGAIRWYMVEDAAINKLPDAVGKVVERVTEHDAKFDQVGDSIKLLTDAALVKKATLKAQRKECLKWAARDEEGRCPEVED